MLPEAPNSQGQSAAAVLNATTGETTNTGSRLVSSFDIFCRILWIMFDNYLISKGLETSITWCIAESAQLWVGDGWPIV